jgi:hypothetical protein
VILAFPRLKSGSQARVFEGVSQVEDHYGRPRSVLTDE